MAKPLIRTRVTRCRPPLRRLRPPPPATSKKLSYKDQRDYELLPKRIEELEAAIARGEAILSDPGLYTNDPQKFATINKGLENARAEKHAAEERWLQLAELVEG